jgi:broad specificity phosphatase PhoE
LTTLLLVRHGETDWNRDRRWQGRTGPPLNAAGRAQAAELVANLRGIDAIYSSDSKRALETAFIIAEHHGLSVQTDPRLQEVDFGLWEGLTRAQINERFGATFVRWLSGQTPTPDSGESDATMAERVIGCLDEIAVEHPEACVVVVTSGGPIRAVEARLRGIEQRRCRDLVETVPNCAVVDLTVAAGSWAYGASLPSGE